MYKEARYIVYNNKNSLIQSIFNYSSYRYVTFIQCIYCIQTDSFEKMEQERTKDRQMVEIRMKEVEDSKVENRRMIDSLTLERSEDRDMIDMLTREV